MRILALALATGLGLSTPVAADPTIGIGLSFAFGSGQVDTGIGLRVMSDNRRNRAVATAGVDYMFSSQSLRGTLGVGYLGSNLYGGLDVGYNFTLGDWDYGMGLGAVKTKRAAGGTPAGQGEGGEDDECFSTECPT